MIGAVLVPEANRMILLTNPRSTPGERHRSVCSSGAYRLAAGPGQLICAFRLFHGDDKPSLGNK